MSLSFSIFVGQLMSPHQMSQVSRIALWLMSKVTTPLSEWGSDMGRYKAVSATGWTAKNIARVQNCPHITILNSLSGLCLFEFLSSVFFSFSLFVFLSVSFQFFLSLQIIFAGMHHKFLWALISDAFYAPLLSTFARFISLLFIHYLFPSDLDAYPILSSM